DSGIMLQGGHTVIRGCRVDGNGFGIFIRGVDDCAMEGNEILGSSRQPSAARGNGIHLWKTQRNRLVNNFIHDKRDGLYLSYADASLIAGNRISETRFGIHYMYSHKNELLTNSLVQNVVGATLMFSRQSLVAGNLVLGNRRHGMVFKQLDNSRILNNVVA